MTSKPCAPAASLPSTWIEIAASAPARIYAHVLRRKGDTGDRLDALVRAADNGQPGMADGTEALRDSHVEVAA